MKDSQGQVLTGATVEAVALYDTAVRAATLGYGDAMGGFEAARETAPAFVMAHLGKAWLFVFARDPAMDSQIASLMEAAKALPMNEREQAHFAALRHASAGALAPAVEVLDIHVMRYPFDVLAHLMVAFLDQFQGRIRWVRDRPARALPLWPKDLPGYGTMLAIHGFGLEEMGEYTRADDESRAALEIDPHNTIAHHTVAHVLEMTGRAEDGLGWMQAREAFWATTDSQLQGHIGWHRALFHLELGQYEAALALHDGPMRTTQRPMARRLTDPSSLLWRLAALGYDVSDRWSAVAHMWEGHADGRCFRCRRHFIDPDRPAIRAALSRPSPSCAALRQVLSALCLRRKAAAGAGKRLGVVELLTSAGGEHVE